MLSDKVLDNLPHEIRRRVEPYVEAVRTNQHVSHARTLEHTTYTHH